MNAAWAALITLLAYAVAEFTWLSVNWGSYMSNFRVVTQRSDVVLATWPAPIAYAVLLFSIWYLLLKDAVPGTPAPLDKAAVLGLVVYGIYNLTNLATLPGYSLPLALLDTVWGVAIVTAVVGLYWFLL
jgi:uncharacterized membrane protein